MTTKVEPTVEKWESKAKEIAEKYVAHPDNLIELRNDILTLLAHSVQEAKAEMIERIEQLKWEPKGCDETYWYTRGDDVIRSQVYFEAIKDALASLKQEDV